MKKSLLVLSAAAIALSGMAATPKQKLQASTMQFGKAEKVQPFGNLRVENTPKSLLKAPAKLGTPEDVIKEVEGTRQDMTVTGSGYYLFWGIMLAGYENESVASHIIYGENNEVYLYDIIPNAICESYVKGVKEGDKIVVDLPQTVFWDDEYQDGYNLTMLKYEVVEPEPGEEDEPQGTYVEDEEVTSFSFTMDEDGVWTAEIAEDQLLGLTLCSGGWSGYGAYELSMVEFNDKPVALPEDYEVSENFWVYDAGGYGWTVSWSQGYDQVFFKGLSENLPDAWIRGSMSFDEDAATIKIAQDQYLGTYSGYYIYTKAAQILYDEEEGYEYYELMPEDYQYEMVWDYENNIITGKDPNVALLFNASKEEVYYLDEFYDLKLVHQEDFAGTPANPFGLEYADNMADYGESYFAFNVPAVSTEGDVLVSDNMYYVLYVDGDEWEFSPEDYDIEEEMVEIPWTFDCWDIARYTGTLREVVFYVEGITTLGVQSVYKYDGEETRSEIVTLDLEADPDAVGTVNAGKKVSSVKYYGLDGREVANPAAGIFVKRVIFEDGSVATFKKAIR